MRLLCLVVFVSVKYMMERNEYVTEHLATNRHHNCIADNTNGNVLFLAASSQYAYGSPLHTTHIIDSSKLNRANHDIYVGERQASTGHQDHGTG